MGAVIVVSRFASPYSGIASALISVLIFDWFFDQHPHYFDLNLAGLQRSESQTATLSSKTRRHFCEPRRHPR